MPEINNNFLFINFLLFFLFHYLVNYFATFFKLTDKPDNIRKLHKGNIPLVGGLIIYLTIIFSNYFSNLIFLDSYLIFVSLLVIISILDDKFNINPLIRISIQIIIFYYLIEYTGLKILHLGDMPNGEKLYLKDVSIPFTIICLLTITNAFNFIDGIDGLCASAFLFSIFNIILYSLILGLNFETQEVGILISISLIVFLFLMSNFGMVLKKNFLGDTGSNLLGLILGIFLIHISQKNNNIFSSGLIPWMISIPIFDIVRLTFVRLYLGKSPFAPDRNHMHHFFKEKIKSNFKILLIYFLINLYAITFGFTIYFYFGGFASGVSFIFFIITHIIFFETYKKLN